MWISAMESPRAVHRRGNECGTGKSTDTPHPALQNYPQQQAHVLGYFWKPTLFTLPEASFLGLVNPLTL
jgi:hypothetical protein